MSSICFNGHTLPAVQALFTAGNRPLRFGDGVFETMKVYKGSIRLESHHWERLFSSLAVLKINIPPAFSVALIRQQLLALCNVNNCIDHGRVRLSVYRGIDNEPLQYLIECWPLDNSFNELNGTGYTIDVFPGGRKCADAFSALKTNNFIAYVMAIDYANENKLDDCLLLNQFDRIADSTIATVFVIKDQTIKTPSIEEGCINGVMRRHLIQSMRESGYTVEETGIAVDELEVADEVFLTNAIRGIRWVKQFRDRIYTNQLTTEIYSRFIQTLI
ncbi:MAG TPA: aminotransferase class IV [Chitinophagaceae bacterium]